MIRGHHGMFQEILKLLILIERIRNRGRIDLSGGYSRGKDPSAAPFRKTELSLIKGSKKVLLGARWETEKSNYLWYGFSFEYMWFIGI